MHQDFSQCGSVGPFMKLTVFNAVPRACDDLQIQRRQLAIVIETFPIRPDLPEFAKLARE